ncbi:MAG TPA: hypothetical protein ENI56_00730 [Candidatus Kaiserbacteria bacterium]|nr:hypothetical protein [Candidatus Kaiserbacteria bacterium]
MSNGGVQFEEPGYRAPSRTESHSTFIDFLIKIGIVKSKQQATYVLLGIIIVTVIITFFVLSSSKPHFIPIHQEQAPPGWTP